MNILGLHFGHDGGVAVVRDGQPVVVVLTERISRIKHGRSLDETMIHDALAAAGIGVDEIDFCAVTTTQTYPIFTAPDQSLRVHFRRHPKDPIPSHAEEHTSGKLDALILERSDSNRQMAKTRREWNSSRGDAPRLGIHKTEGDLLVAGFAPEMLPRPKFVLKDHSLTDIRDFPVELKHVGGNNRYWLHYPVTVELDGKQIPGAFVDHHTAHAAGTYYQSGLSSGLVITYDGAERASMSSGTYFAMDNVIVPMVLPRMWNGAYYNRVAARIFPGCDAGKMMGLAPYGKPAFYDANALGTASEKGYESANHLADEWIGKALARAQALGYDLSPLGDRSAALAPINVDLAASAHQTFEDNLIAMVAACKTSYERAAALRGRTLEGLCFAGGCALSCPTNTRAALTSGFGRVFVDPSCDDSGLSLGGALWVYHNLFDRLLLPRNPDFPMSPYLGLTYSRAAVTAAIEARRGSLRVETPADAARAAGEDLAADRVVGWFEGRSEIGPRALGHRSILSDPRREENWARVNRIKSRERWRPFAPAVLKDEAGKWFRDMPLPSPYMLFTGNVVDSKALPAITHVDGTARVQTVTRECGGFFDVLTSFQSLTGCPVVMNTSLNGPGEPIVETPQDAINFFVNSQLDAIYVDGLRITKA